MTAHLPKLKITNRGKYYFHPNTILALKSAPDRTRTCTPQIRKPKAGFVTPTSKGLTAILKANDYPLTTATTYGNHELDEANLKLKINPMCEGSLNGN